MDEPSRPAQRAKTVVHSELSTDEGIDVPLPVDDLPQPPVEHLWLGTVVPKRHARRSVTRTLLKRQIRAAVGRQGQLPGGLWVVRLRAPFDGKHFVSAASHALRHAARVELDAVLAAALRRAGRL